MKSFLLASTVVALLSLAACGGGGIGNPPPPQDFNIAVTVTGLTGTLVLQDNTGVQLTFSSSTTQTFSNTYTSGASYSVSVVTPPTGEVCTPGSNASGTITSNVTITVACAPSGSTFTLSASVTGLAGTLVLQDNLNDTLTFNSDGTQTFATGYSSGQPYQVIGVTQPAGQTCTLSSNSTGTITTNTTVTVTCSTSGGNTGTISVAATGLTGTLVVQDDKGDTLSLTSASPSQTFATSYASGATYTVSVKTQPTGQNCTLSSNATGTIAAANTTVTATCTTTTVNETLSVAVTGLTGTLVMQDDKGDNLTFSSNNTQTFATQYASGTTYTVSVKTQPTGQNCTLSGNSTGTITAATTVTATCTTTTQNFSISVAVTGLTGTLVMQDDKGDNLTFSSNNTQTFATQYASGTTYTVSVKTQPSGQSCALSGNATGSISANTTVTATCATTTTNDTISVAVTGLSGTLVVQDDKSDTLTFTSNNTQQFATSYTSGSTYTVSIKTQPTGQTCTLGGNASGTITANTTVNATCVSNFTISVTATGLTGTLVMQDSKSDNLTFTTNNTQTFATSYASGSSYTVSVKTQPTGQNCTLSGNASGTITANVTVTATCTATTQNFTLSVTTTGLSGGSLVVQDDQSDSLTFTSNKTQTFATSYASGSTYSVSVITQPSGQNCTLSGNANGTITANTTVTATCTASGGSLTVSVNVTGLSGTVTMQNDLGDTLTFTSNKTQTFSSTYANGSNYTVYVTGQPAAQSCIPTYATGTITSDVTINATCATGATRALGSVKSVSTVACKGALTNGVCQQMTVSCPGVPNVQAYVKTNTPSGTSLGTVTYGTGTDGNGLYESIFTFGTTAVGNVLDAGFTTVQISWGTPFNTAQPNGWVEGPGGVLASACRYATVTQWIYDNIHNDNKSAPYCATANSGGSGALAYTLSQYPTSGILSMAEVTSGPPTGRLDWGCGCTHGSVAVQCGSSSSLGTCFGTADAPVWDPAYNPNADTGLCSAAVTGTLPPGGLNFFLGDSVEAPGANYNLSKTHVNLVFGDADNSSAIPIGQDWFNNITSTKSQACVSGGQHSLANTQAGALQIANDLINLCQLQ